MRSKVDIGDSFSIDIIMLKKDLKPFSKERKQSKKGKKRHAWLGKIDVWIRKTENLTLRLFQYMCMVHCFIKLVNIEEKI